MQNNLIEYCNRNGLLILRILCFEIRAKDISKHKFTGDSGKVKKIFNWIYTLDFNKRSVAPISDSLIGGRKD